MPGSAGITTCRRGPTTPSRCRRAPSTSSSTSTAKSSAPAAARPFVRCERGSDAMTPTFDALQIGSRIDGPSFGVSRESIQLFCDASLDYNPLHLDDCYMAHDFGKTNFGG